MQFVQKTDTTEGNKRVSDVRFDFALSSVSILQSSEDGTLGRSCSLEGGGYWDHSVNDAGRIEGHVNTAKAKNAVISLMAGYAAEVHYGSDWMQARSGASSRVPWPCFLLPFNEPKNEGALSLRAVRRVGCDDACDSQD